MSEEDLRDCFAMFAMLGVVQINKEPYDDRAVAELAYSLADHMLKVRKGEKSEEDSGIVAVVPKRSRKR